MTPDEIRALAGASDTYLVRRNGRIPEALRALADVMEAAKTIADSSSGERPRYVTQTERAEYWKNETVRLRLLARPAVAHVEALKP